MTSVALSLDGSMMSTAEVKLAEEGIGGLVSLKFWALGSDKRNFSLSTIVYEPHRLAKLIVIYIYIYISIRYFFVSISYIIDLY